MAFAVASPLTGCGPPEELRNDSGETAIEQVTAPSAITVDGRSSQVGSWTAYSVVDPLIDIETTVANRTFRTGAYAVELQVGYGNDNWITYTANTFDQNGDGAPMDWAFGPDGLELTVQIRVDRDDPARWFTEKRRYSNQFKLSGPTKFLARGMALTMRFAMPNADATIFIDQGDPMFRRVVEPCLETAPEPAPSATDAPEATEGEDATPQPSDASTNANEVGNEGPPL